MPHAASGRDAHRRIRSRRRGHAARQRHRGAASQHGEAARESHDAAPVRRARRLLLGATDGLQPRRAARAHAHATSPAGAWKRKIPRRQLSEPVKPIVYYIDAATPTKWVPWMKSGIEDWQKAFEAAGFKNAIIAKLAPTPEEDPDFSPEDVRYSVIRWLPSTIENAIGPAHLRSAHRRDSQRGHPVLSQRHEPAARLVFPAGGPARSARAEAAAAGRSDGPAARIRGARTKSATRSASSTT